MGRDLLEPRRSRSTHGPHEVQRQRGVIEGGPDGVHVAADALQPRHRDRGVDPQDEVVPVAGDLLGQFDARAELDVELGQLALQMPA